MKNKYLALLTAVCLSTASVAFGDDVTVNWNNNSTTLLLNNAGTPLTEGLAGVNTDGALIQLGYFSMADASNNFAGTWIPITGVAPAPNTSIGDSSAPNAGVNRSGRYAFNTFFTIGSNLVQVYDPVAQSAGAYVDNSSVTITEGAGATPPNNQVMAIRFYDSDTGTGMFNTVSADIWQWQTPSINDPSKVVTFSLFDPNATLEWQGGANSAFRTTLTAVPEPSTYASALLGFGLFAVGAVRRRFKS